jgi:hypothetical protein
MKLIEILDGIGVTTLNTFEFLYSKCHKAQREISYKLNSLCVLTIRVTSILPVWGFLG